MYAELQLGQRDYRDRRLIRQLIGHQLASPLIGDEDRSGEQAPHGSSTVSGKRLGQLPAERSVRLHECIESALPRHPYIRARQRSKFGDGPAVDCHTQALARLDPTEDLGGAIPQLTNRDIAAMPATVAMNYT